MSLLLVASFAAVANAKSFLDSRVGVSSVKGALLSELFGMADASQLLKIDEELRPMYASLPKNRHGRLDPVPVRYALHRYFMQKHGWYVNGLGAANSTGNASTSATIMKDRAPSLIQSIFEERLHGQGLSRHDLAVFAATLTDLIHNEVGGSLGQAYSALELPTVGRVSEQQFDIATKAYLLAYLSGGREMARNRQELPRVEKAWEDDFPAWGDFLMWASDLKLTTDLADQQRLNPFAVERRASSFDQQVSFLQEFGHRLGSFQNLECRRLKTELAEMEDVGTGRVPLSRFYRGGLEGDWTFSESVEYLRHIGALDESNPKRMSVVIPNYIQSQSNCLAGSSFYSVCCLDECEGLLGNLEQAVQQPSAPPSQIAALISSLPSDTVDAPRNLSVALLGRLEDIARLHSGTVPLHGRLFAQWMHHTYPRECPFPHVIGAVDRMSPSEWMDAMDIDSPEADAEVMLSHVRSDESDEKTSEAKAEALPWTMAEELVAGHLSMAEAAPAYASQPTLRLALAALLLASLAVSMARHTNSVLVEPSRGKATRYEV